MASDKTRYTDRRHPKISIVTPSYNQCRFLQQTLDCVLGQEGGFELEMLVVDGGSTDGSVELLKSILDPRLRWLSEPDRGQTEALRKGLDRATGDIVGWLNSDDLYVPGALATVADAFAEHPDAQWLVGRCQIIDAQGRETARWMTRYKDYSLKRYSYRRLLRANFISQMSVFWRRSFGREVGDPDITLHHAMDYDLWLRMAQRSEPLILKEILAQFRWHDASKTSTVFRARFRGEPPVSRRHAGGHRGSLLLNRWHNELTILGYQLMWRLGWIGRRSQGGG